MSGNELRSTARNQGPPQTHVWRPDVLLILCAGIASFAIGLPDEFMGLDARYALFAREMLRNGLSFFPTAFGAPYADYPTTTILPIVWLSRITGAVTPLAAILPTAVVSSGILVVTYLIGAIRSRPWGLGAACMCFLTLAFLRAARSVSPDQWISLATITSFYLAYSAQELGHRRRLWLVPLLLVFGFACRGPIGLIIPASAVLTFCLCNRQFKAAALWAAVSVAILIVGSRLLLTAAEFQSGEGFSQRVWEMQVSGRMTRSGRGAAYYWLTAFGSYAFAYPMAVLTTAKLWPRITKRPDAAARLLRSLAFCAGVILLGMSIPAGKKTRYVLSIVPFVALIAAYPLVIPDVRSEVNRLANIARRCCAALLTIVLVACPVRALLVAFHAIPGELFFARTCVGTLLATVPALGIFLRSADCSARNLEVLAFGAASLVILHIVVVEPCVWARETSRAFAQQVQGQCTSVDLPVVFYRLGPDCEDVILAGNMSASIRPRYLNSGTSIAGLPSSTCILATAGSTLGIPREMRSQLRAVGKGRLGGTPVVLYRKKEAGS